MPTAKSDMTQFSLILINKTNKRYHTTLFDRENMMEILKNYQFIKILPNKVNSSAPGARNYIFKKTSFKKSGLPVCTMREIVIIAIILRVSAFIYYKNSLISY